LFSGFVPINSTNRCHDVITLPAGIGIHQPAFAPHLTLVASLALAFESSLGWVATKFGNRKSTNQLSSWHWKKACDGLRNVKVESAILKDPIKMAKNAWLWMKGSQKKL